MNRRHTLVAGLALLALTNAVALGGALWNRSGDPEAGLRLTDRELHGTGSINDRENSGLSLRLGWRVLTGEARSFGYSFSGGAPAWLDRAKMESLGFDTSAFVRWSDRARARYEKQLPREVLLVLELEGPAYQRALEQAKRRAEKELAKPVVPGNPAAALQRQSIREALEWETSRSSRLFMVDAGVDADALRARYPDRARYAIVRGEVKPWIVSRKMEEPGGYVSSVSVASVNVPLRLRAVFTGVDLSEHYGPAPRTPFAATVAWGRRLEPWLVDAARK